MAPRIIIDFPQADGRPGRRLFYAPQQIIEVTRHGDVLPALAEIHAHTNAGATAVGFLSYEAAPAFDQAFHTHPSHNVPLLWFAVFEQEQIAPAIETTAESALPQWTAAVSREQHAQAITRIRDEIAAGTTYQVNYTVRMQAALANEPLALYETLRHAQGVGYHAYIETADWCVLSLSPELFFETSGRRIVTRPMKGTRPRGRFREEDDLLIEELRASAKERAENLMIVDLMRNDVGRIAERGSVQVARLYDVERYPTVLQMTSTVEAVLQPDMILPDLMRALFPPGSVTGAPKISTMRLIKELEPSPRGIYCGALGVVERSGCTFNVPIRTIWLDRRNDLAAYGTGSGITADSDADQEFDELITKTVVVSQPWPSFQLLETMRAQHGQVVRLDRHLARLAESAEYFGFEYCADAIDAELQRVLRGIDDPVRLRMLLSATGKVSAEVHALEPLPEVRKVTCAAAPIETRDRFVFHKTTHRRAYEQHARAAPDMFDVLLYNQQDELTEFTRANVVLEIDGKRLTPARSCGLLAGVFRGELLDEGVVSERVIHRTDLAKAERIWWINSLREWVEVEPA